MRFIVLFVAFFSFVAGLHAQCSAADMKGDFATQPQGILTGGPFAGPFAATGVIHFDGVGKFAGVATSSFNGGVIYPFDAVGHYEVSADCFVTILETTLQIGFEGYISATKNEVVLVQPDEGAITTNVLRKMFISSCDSSYLNNYWAIQSVGSNIVTQGRFAQNGRLKFDGKGGFTGVTASSVEGTLIRKNVSGTYSVDGECNFLGRLVDQDGVVSHFFGTLFNQGEQFIFIYSDDGLVIPGQGRQAVNVSK
jgi:hypothetical protein